MKVRTLLIALALAWPGAILLPAQNDSILPEAAEGALKSAAEAEKEAEAAPVDAPPPATLQWWNRDIATFRATAENQTPAARVSAALERLDQSTDEWAGETFSHEKASYEEQTIYRFLVGDTYLFTLLESDLDTLAGETLEKTADQSLASLNEIRQARIDQASAKFLIKGITHAVIATLIFVVAVLVLRWITRKIAVFVVGRVKKWRQLKIGRSDLRPYLATGFEQLVKLPSFFLFLYLLCVWIAYVFNQFPRTAPLGEAFTGHLLSFAKSILGEITGAIPGIVTAGLILFAARWVARIADRTIAGLGDDSSKGVMANDTAKATRRIAAAFIWLFAIVLAYPYIPGSGSAAFQGLSVLIGLMVSLGSSGLINQVMSGFVLLYSGSVRTGEYIKVGEVEGTITEMGLLAVKVLNPAKEFLVIPNAVMLSNPMKNFSRLSEDTGVPVSAVVTIGYDTPWRQVHQLLTDSAAATAQVLEDPPPRVIQSALSDWYPEYKLICYIKDPQQRTAVLSELNGHIQDAFNEAEVAIMSPHYNADTPEPLVIPKDRWFPKVTGPENTAS